MNMHDEAGCFSSLGLTVCLPVCSEVQYGSTFIMPREGVNVITSNYYIEAKNLCMCVYVLTSEYSQTIYQTVD